MPAVAVGRALVDMQRYEEGLPYLQKAADGDPNRTWVDGDGALDCVDGDRKSVV